MPTEELHETSSTPVSKPNPKKQNVKAIAIGFGILVAIVVIVTLGVGVYKVLAKGATDGFSRTVGSVLRLPAVKVNDQAVLYKDYVTELDAIKKVRAYDIQNNTPNARSAAAMTDQQLSDQVLIRLVYNILASNLAREVNVKVEEADIKEVHDALLAELGTDLAINQELDTRYGWDYKAYETRVIRPLLLQSKLAEMISTDVAAREAVQKKAQDILDQIKAGAKFEEMAAQHGQDASAANNGSLGEFTSSALKTEEEEAMVPAFENAVSKLKKGELAANLVETEFGFHIVRLDSVRKEKTKDANGKTVDKPYWTASHIIILHPSLNQHLNDKLKQADVHMYISVNNPFRDLVKK